jgi:hypothetical protein
MYEEYDRESWGAPSARQSLDATCESSSKVGVSKPSQQLIELSAIGKASASSSGHYGRRCRYSKPVIQKLSPQ